jgi:hypothetical protein
LRGFDLNNVVLRQKTMLLENLYQDLRCEFIKLAVPQTTQVISYCVNKN